MASCCYGSTRKLVSLVFFMAMYLVFGALTFMFLEGESEEEIREDLGDIIKKFMFHHRCVNSKYRLKLIHSVTSPLRHGYISD